VDCPPPQLDRVSQTASHRRERKLGNGVLEVLPSVPGGQASVSGTNIRAGVGSVDVAARHDGASWTTTVTTR
jgi:hypothetical protein